MATSIQQCVICYDELDRDLSAAPCGHVFHNVCIDRWRSHGSHCPMCHEDLPPKLLRLFFEPKQEAVQTPQRKTSSSLTDGTESSSEDGAGEHQHQQHRVSSDPEATRLRRELAAMTKLNTRNQEESASLGQKLAEVHNELLETKVTHNMIKEKLEGKLKSATAVVDAAKLDLFRVNKENNRLKREMIGAQNKLRQSQGERVALDFLQHVASKITGSRPHTGLGQVDVDQVLRLVEEGSAKAETVIKGQYELLSAAIERERRTKRELRQSKADHEAREIEVNELRAKLVKSKKERHRLSEELGKGRRGGSSDSLPMESTRDYAKKIDSCNDWQVGGSFLPRKVVGEPRHRNVKGNKRSAPAGLDGDYKEAALVPEKRRASAVEGDDGMVSLGSDGESASEDEKECSVSKESKYGRDMCASLSLGQLEPQTLGIQAKSSHSFLGSAAMGGSARQKPGKFIRSGFNAMGGRHNVLHTSNKPVGIRNTQRPSDASRR